MYYTIGQRKGLKIGGSKNASELPWFVAKKNLNTNELLVVQGHDHPLLLKYELFANDLHFISGTNPVPGLYTAKTRYRMIDAKCSLSYIDANTMQVTFSNPQWAITPGQSIVVYDGNICLGGGIVI